MSSDYAMIVDHCGCVNTWTRQDSCDTGTYGYARMVSPGCPEGHWGEYEALMEWIKVVREDGTPDASGPV